MEAAIEGMASPGVKGLQLGVVLSEDVTNSGVSGLIVSWFTRTAD